MELGSNYTNSQIVQLPLPELGSVLSAGLSVPSVPIETIMKIIDGQDQAMLQLLWVCVPASNQRAYTMTDKNQIVNACAAAEFLTGTAMYSKWSVKQRKAHKQNDSDSVLKE